MLGGACPGETNSGFGKENVPHRKPQSGGLFSSGRAPAAEDRRGREGTPFFKTSYSVAENDSELLIVPLAAEITGIRLSSPWMLGADPGFCAC